MNKQERTGLIRYKCDLVMRELKDEHDKQVKIQEDDLDALLEIDPKLHEYAGRFRRAQTVFAERVEELSIPFTMTSGKMIIEDHFNTIDGIRLQTNTLNTRTRHEPFRMDNIGTSLDLRDNQMIITLYNMRKSTHQRIKALGEAAINIMLNADGDEQLEAFLEM